MLAKKEKKHCSLFLCGNVNMWRNEVFCLMFQTCYSFKFSSFLYIFLHLDKTLPLLKQKSYSWFMRQGLPANWTLDFCRTITLFTSFFWIVEWFMEAFWFISYFCLDWLDETNLKSWDCQMVDSLKSYSKGKRSKIREMRRASWTSALFGLEEVEGAAG